MKALCSDTVELEVGSHVRVRPSGRISGRFSMHGQVTAVHDSGTQKTYDVQLTKMFMSGANGGERIRDKKASKLMKKEFAHQLGADGRTLWLKQSQIRGWFSCKVAGLKRAALDRALAELAEAEEAGEGGGD